MNTRCEWQPIGTAPRDGTPLLLFHPAWDMPQIGVHYGETNVWQSFCGDLLREPTHWMALPPLPAAAHDALKPAA